MKRIPPVVVYTVLRLLTFATPLTLLLLIRVTPWLATVLAALIGFSVSYIFLRAPREQVALDLYERRHGEREKPSDDEDAEDAALDDDPAITPIDAAEAPGSETPRQP